MRWPWKCHHNGQKERADKAEAELRRVRKMTPAYERLADVIMVSPDEFMDRVAKAFQRRST